MWLPRTASNESLDVNVIEPSMPKPPIWKLFDWGGGGVDAGRVGGGGGLRGGSWAAAGAMERQLANAAAATTTMKRGDMRVLAGQAQAAQRGARIDQSESIRVVSSGRTLVDGKLFHGRFDRRRIGDALLHQQRREA